METTGKIADVVVVGAGICGLTAAGSVVEHGASAILLDKGRSVGGRLATRRIGAGRADHGAQFFTARNARFTKLVDTWTEQGLVFRWSTGWSDGSLAKDPAGVGHPRYAARDGMSSLPKHLADQQRAAGAQILTDVKVLSVAHTRELWIVAAEDGREWRGRTLVLTPPAPQALQLLDAGNVDLPAEQRRALEAIAYAPCLCAMLLIDGSVWLPAPGAVQRPHEDIVWIADNERKGISPHATVLTLHGSPQWSAAHYHDPDDELVDSFRDALNPWLDGGDRLRAAEIKRWRYALPTVLHPQSYLRAEGCPPLLLGGDGFGAPRVEGAVLSGLDMGNALIAELGLG
jgi:renalase